MVDEINTDLDFPILFPHSAFQYNGDKIQKIDVNLNKALITEIKIGIAGDQVKIIFHNANGSNDFCPKNWVIRTYSGKARFSEDMIYEICNTSIYDRIYFFFDDVSKHQKITPDFPEIVCDTDQIKKFVNNLAHGIIKQFDKLGIPYDFSSK